jgi:hypothetical protein
VRTVLEGSRPWEYGVGRHAQDFAPHITGFGIESAVPSVAPVQNPQRSFGVDGEPAWCSQLAGSLTAPSEGALKGAVTSEDANLAGLTIEDVHLAFGPQGEPADAAEDIGAGAIERAQAKALL